MNQESWKKLDELGKRILRMGGKGMIDSRRGIFMEYVALCEGFPDSEFEYSPANFQNLLKLFCVFGQNTSFRVGTGDLERTHKVFELISTICARTAGMPDGVVIAGVDLFDKPRRLIYRRKVRETSTDVETITYTLDGGLLKQKVSIAKKRRKGSGWSVSLEASGIAYNLSANRSLVVKWVHLAGECPFFSFDSEKFQTSSQNINCIKEVVDSPSKSLNQLKSYLTRFWHYYQSNKNLQIALSGT